MSLNLDEAIKLVEKESKSFCNKLVKKGVPIEEIDVDVDDVGMCEPFIHIHVNLENDWFYKQIEGGE